MTDNTLQLPAYAQKVQFLSASELHAMENFLKKEQLFVFCIVIFFLLWYNTRKPCRMEGGRLMETFQLHAPFQPTGDQPEAIRELVDGFRSGNTIETLLCVTGS